MSDMRKLLFTYVTATSSLKQAIAVAKLKESGYFIFS